MKKRQYSRVMYFFVKYSIVCCFFLCMASIAVAEISTDGSLGPKKSLAGPNYKIPDTLGQTMGSNLFHSFDKFNIETGYSATFTGPHSIQNVISRVTGGSPSSIDGLLQCMIPGANLYLINPSGVMFGPNASLDVTGSFHVSTADYLKFSDGGAFYANPNVSSVLSVAEPQAFGFLSSSPAGISAEKAYLQVPEGKTISIIGGEIIYTAYPLSTDYSSPDYMFNAPSVLTAPGGRINIASIASPGEVNLSNLDTGTAKLGAITFSDGAKLSVLNFDSDWNPLPAGNIVIRGGQMLFKNGGMDAYGNPGGTIDIKGESLHLDTYYLYAAGYGDIDHPGTACRIEVSNEFSMTHGSLIDTSPFAQGRGGDIRINASYIKLGDDTLDSQSYTDPYFSYYGYVSSTTTGSGRGGDIYLSSTGDMTIQNGFFVSTATNGINGGTGDAGNITVLADTIKFLDKGNIATDAFGSGKGGIVDVAARNMLISATNENDVTNIDTTTGIAAHVGSFSDGSKVLIKVDDLQIMDGGRISTVLFGEGRGADAEINAKNISISGFSLDTDGIYFLSAIDGRVYGAAATGSGGNIFINTDSLKIADGGAIRTGLYSDEFGSPSGHAGSITINAGAIDISNRGQIYADSFRGTGDSGDINIHAADIHITGVGNTPAPSPLDFDFTGFSTTTNAGRGGTINLDISGDLTIGNRGGINADTQGAGPGGAVHVTAQNILLIDRSTIGAASTGIGNAGNIDITSSNSLLMSNSAITTEAMLADGGNISIKVPYMVKLEDSKITASVGGGPQTTGGNISIDPQYVILKNSQIVANAYEGQGGSIQIVTDTFLSDPQSVVDASSTLGISGTVDIHANVTNVNGLLTPLSADFVSAANLLREPCMARLRGGKYSSFIVSGRDGLPIEPGNLLPSHATKF